jgi:hypothetical protein
MLCGQLLDDVDRYQAANGLDEPIRKVMLSSPAHFTPEQCKRLHNAAVLAGNQVVGQIYDITAASATFAYRHATAGEGKDEQVQNVLFLDIGHCFASAQVVTVDPANKTLKILATESKNGCGAEAFDKVLVDLWIDLLKTKHKIVLDDLKPIQKERALMRLNTQAAKAKSMLSGLPEVDIVVDSVVPELDLRSKVSRAQMEEGASHVVKDIAELLNKVVEKAGLAKTDIVRCEIVGGGSRVPIIQNLVKTEFGQVFKTLDNECSVAMGAALLGAIKEGIVEFTVEGVQGPSYDDAPGLSEEEMATVKALEEKFRADDLEIRMRNDAKNLLEQFVFDTRRESSEQTVGVDDEDTMDKLRSFLTGVEDWIYEDGENCPAAEVTKKLETAQEEAKAIAPKLFEVLQKKEEKAREERLKSQQEVIAPSEKSKKKPMRPSEKIAEAKKKKEHGNSLIKDVNYEDATRRYTQALGICAEMDGTLNPDDQSEVNDIKYACYCNLSLANVRLKVPKLGVYNSTKAIELFPEKPKAYLRRAQAKCETKDFEEAKADILMVKKYDPEDKLNWGKFLTKTELNIKREKDKQKKQYANMFK